MTNLLQNSLQTFLKRAPNLRFSNSISLRHKSIVNKLFKINCIENCL